MNIYDILLGYVFVSFCNFLVAINKLLEMSMSFLTVLEMVYNVM